VEQQMPIPDFDSNGCLPHGIHDCVLSEIEERFGTFRTTDARRRLFDRLKSFVKELEGTGLVSFIIIDGSYVTQKHDPNDIDLILVLHSNHDFSAQLRPFEYNALSRRQVRRNYGFDILLAQEGRPELDEFVRFFAQVRGVPELSKGLLRVWL
jgi:hypothetical protein